MRVAIGLPSKPPALQQALRSRVALRMKTIAHLVAALVIAPAGLAKAEEKKPPQLDESALRQVLSKSYVQHSR